MRDARHMGINAEMRARHMGINAEMCARHMGINAERVRDIWALMRENLILYTSIICALGSPAGKGLTSWLSFVVSNCEFVTFPLVSWVRCGT